ncbi:hypothetical protein GW17_00020255 [Ensete ventricosum]|nr:hypothetical protein GW17_00020255 [Ensete ventricosum]
MQEMAQLSLFPPPPPAQPLFLPRVVTGAESVSASCKAATCPWGGEEADGVRGTSSPPAHVLFSRSLVDLLTRCLFVCLREFAGTGRTPVVGIRSSRARLGFVSLRNNWE